MISGTPRKFPCVTTQFSASLQSLRAEMMTVRKSKNNTHVALCDKKGEARTTHEMQCAHNMPKFVWGTVMCSQVLKQLLMLSIFHGTLDKTSKHRDLSGRKHGTKDWLGDFTCRTLTRKNTKKHRITGITLASLLLQVVWATTEKRYGSLFSLVEAVALIGKRNRKFLLACLILPSIIFNRFVLRCFATKCKSRRRGIGWNFKSVCEVHGDKVVFRSRLVRFAFDMYLSWSYHVLLKTPRYLGRL